IKRGEQAIPIASQAIPIASHGFALVEILVAMSIISIGLLGLAGAMTVQSGGLSSSIAMGQGAVTRGYYVSTATLLAQDRLEQVKRLTYCAACNGGAAL